MKNIIGIYKITSPTGRVYIGQSVNVKKRISQYKFLNCKNQNKLYNSLKKHGFENHKFEVIEECEVEKLNERERYWQDHYDVLGDKGLNCLLTNTSDKKLIHSIDTIRILSRKSKGRKHTDETKKKMSIVQKNRWRKIDKSKIFLSKESRYLMSEKMKKNKNGLENLKKGSNKGLPILQLDMNMNLISEFSSKQEAYVKTGADPSGILRCIRGESMHCKGFLWRYKFIEHIGNSLTNTNSLNKENLTYNSNFII